MASKISIFNKTKDCWALAFLLLAPRVGISLKSCGTFIVGIVSLCFLSPWGRWWIFSDFVRNLGNRVSRHGSANGVHAGLKDIGIPLRLIHYFILFWMHSEIVWDLARVVCCIPLRIVILVLIRSVNIMLLHAVAMIAAAASSGYNSLLMLSLGCGPTVQCTITHLQTE